MPGEYCLAAAGGAGATGVVVAAQAEDAIANANTAAHTPRWRTPKFMLRFEFFIVTGCFDCL